MLEDADCCPMASKVFPNQEDLTDLQVTIEDPEGTPYAGSLFSMKVLLGKDFAASPPKGYFLTKIFHPTWAPKVRSVSRCSRRTGQLGRATSACCRPSGVL
ncbi:hypothetical protein E2I00_015369 [Balaenoptera physalus]|uniref:UBC core domain-containing protein n=1 Tax=Balaenoptera physalus TaxID=9770 RepID=A0A643CA62_BALPH|nr:hypothetical protein E2I00_015369 [Balaenoptera physalus]